MRSGRIDNPNFNQEMIEYNRRKKSLEEDEEEQSETLEVEAEYTVSYMNEDDELKDDFNQDEDFLRRPRKILIVPLLTA